MRVQGASWRSWRVTDIGSLVPDYTPKALEAARRNVTAARVPGEFVQGDDFALPFSKGSFDAVLSTGLLELTSLLCL